jgi:glycine/serine hydroxymethyltransferase
MDKKENDPPDSLKEFILITKEFIKFQSKSVPLCAAENIISPFAKLPLDIGLQERYLMGGIFGYDANENFIGSELLYPYYEKINQQCKKLFDSTYADARTLSGMNAITSLLMALTEQNDTIILSLPETGGHPSIPIICKRLGLNVEPIPYNYHIFDYDYSKLNDLISAKKPKAVVFVPSDIISIPKLDRLKVNNTYIIYDATQTLGLIASKVIENPLKQNQNVILLGGTHKTLPGPTNGLIMTCNTEIAKQIDNSISPKFVRNTQMHQVACLLLTLIEIEHFGKNYSEQIIKNANILGNMLIQKGFSLPFIGEKYTNTHQLFILTDKEQMNRIFMNSLTYGITLNKKEKLLFRGYGIRIGVQEITRYGWGEFELELISQILKFLDTNDVVPLKRALKLLHKKDIFFTFDEKTITWIINNLQEN